MTNDQIENFFQNAKLKIRKVKIDFKTKKINFLGRDKIFLKIVLIVFLLSLLVFGIK